MTHMSIPETITIERHPPEETFALLANTLRVDILQTLGENDGPLSFSALRSAVGEPDSGQFNYHLGKLVDQFVVHDADGYRLSLAGRAMYGAILSGAYTTDATIESFEFDGPCPMCGHEQLTAAYADERARLYCGACDAWQNEFPFPPATLDQFDTTDLPYAFDRWMVATVTKVLDGFCPNCGGRVDTQLVEDDDAVFDVSVRAEYSCRRCGDVVQSYPALPVVFHPVSIAFFDDHGINVMTDPSWQFLQGADGISISVVNSDPLQAKVEFSLGDQTVTAVVGPDVAIDSIQRRSCAGSAG